MKNKIFIILLVLISSFLSGFLIAKMSFFSKVGITFIYDEYAILKSWWQTGLVMFIIQISIYLALTMIQNKAERKVRYYGFPLIFTLIGAIGLYMTYFNFTETSQRLLNNNFKIGFYIFWITWILNCVSFLFNKKTIIKAKEHVDILSDEENII